MKVIEALALYDIRLCTRSPDGLLHWVITLAMILCSVELDARFSDHEEMFTNVFMD